MKKILLPVDVTGINDKTYEFAKDLAKHYDSVIVLLNVINDTELIETQIGDIHMYDSYYKDITLYNRYYSEERASVLVKIAEQLLQAAADKFEKDKIMTIKKIEYGNVASQIIAAVEENECFMVIMPNSNESSFKKFFLGSITDKVVHHVEVPVLIVK